jgi:hypothetical protein
MILEILGREAVELHLNHVPSEFRDRVDDLGEDRGVVFDDDRLSEICRKLLMPVPGDWGYQRLPNRLYSAFGPLYGPEGLVVRLRRQELGEIVSELDAGEIHAVFEKAALDPAGYDSRLEGGLLLMTRVRFRETDVVFQLGDEEFDPEALSLVIHELDDLPGEAGPPVVHHLIYKGARVAPGLGAAEEFDYSVDFLEALG